MVTKINRTIDKLSEYFAPRKGLIPILALVLVISNYIIQFLPQSGWVGSSNLLLHLGIILAIIGYMLAWAL